MFLWAPIAWALVGYFLTGLRQAGITKSDGADALKLAAICSLAMAVLCIFLPATTPASKGGRRSSKASPCCRSRISSSSPSFRWLSPA